MILLRYIPLKHVFYAKTFIKCLILIWSYFNWFITIYHMIEKTRRIKRNSKLTTACHLYNIKKLRCKVNWFLWMISWDRLKVGSTFFIKSLNFRFLAIIRFLMRFVALQNRNLFLTHFFLRIMSHLFKMSTELPPTHQRLTKAK